MDYPIKMKKKKKLPYTKTQSVNSNVIKDGERIFKTLGMEKCMSSFLPLSILVCKARIAALEARIS